MTKYPIHEPETFHLRMRILAMAGIPYRQVGQEVELDQALDVLPTPKQALVKAALDCRLEWRQLHGLSAKEKVAVGVAAMDVERHRQSRMVPV